MLAQKEVVSLTMLSFVSEKVDCLWVVDGIVIVSVIESEEEDDEEERQKAGVLQV